MALVEVVANESRMREVEVEESRRDRVTSIRVALIRRSDNLGVMIGNRILIEWEKWCGTRTLCVSIVTTMVTQRCYVESRNTMMRRRINYDYTIIRIVIANKLEDGERNEISIHLEIVVVTVGVIVIGTKTVIVTVVLDEVEDATKVVTDEDLAPVVARGNLVVEIDVVVDHIEDVVEGRILLTTYMPMIRRMTIRKRLRLEWFK